MLFLCSGCAVLKYDGKSITYTRFMTDWKADEIIANKTGENLTVTIKSPETSSDKAVRVAGDLAKFAMGSLAIPK